MKNPPTIPGGRVQLTDGALEKLQAERMQKIQQHLNEMNHHLTVENSAINAVVLAGIQAIGVPDEKDHADYVENAMKLAKRISERQLARKWTLVKQILKELNVHDIQPSVVFGAKLAGIELFDAPALEQPPAKEAQGDTPKIITH